MLGRGFRHVKAELQVLICFAILSTFGAGCQTHGSSLRAREAALRTDLQTMRNGIDNYTLDKLRRPSS